MTTLLKQPSESSLYDMPMSIRRGDAILQILSVEQIAEAGSGTVDIVSQSFDAGTVQCRLAGGSSGSLYKITVKVLTVNNDTIEDDFRLVVEDL
jgi:hypothetical protein